MSTLSGLATKGEKGKSKFQSLDINSLYRGESLEPAQKTILRKHGMQSLGRVPTARRAPINLPSLKAETSGADPPVSLVPSGGTGWGSKPSGEGGAAAASPAVNQGSAAVAALLPPAAATLQPPNTTQPPSQASLPQSRQPPISGPVGATVAPEFPKLSGGSEVDSSLTNATSGGSSVGGVSQLNNAKGGSTSGVDVQYGPGPSLRPQSMVGDGLGARGAALGAGGPSTPLGQTQVVAGGSGGVPQTGTSPVGPSGGVGAAAGGGGSNAAATPFSGIMPRFMYRGGFPGPGGFPPNFQPPLHGGTQRPQRFNYPSGASGPGATEGEGGPTNRFGPGAGGRPPGPPNVGQGGPQTAEEEVFQRPIIKEEDLNKMDDIVRGNGWATQDDIDYNQKLSFSDDESTEDDLTGQSSRKDAAASSSGSQAPQQGSGNRNVNQNISQHHPIPLLPQSQNPPLHLHLKGKEPEGRRNAIGRSPEDERDGLVDLDHRDDVRGRMDERNRDAKRLDGNRLVDGRVGWGQSGSRSGAPPPLMPPSLMDYRGGSRSSSGINVPSSQQGPAVPPASLGNIMQGPFKMSSHMPFGAATGRLLDDDEVWLEKRRQTTEEVAIAVVRAKQRKEEEEKKFEESKQAAAKKLQNLEEKMGVNKGKKDAQSQQQHVEEGSPEWERDRSRLSSEGREDKGPASNPPVAREIIREIPRDSPGEREFRPAPPLMGGSGGGLSRDRDRDRELRGERDRDRHDYKFSRAFQSNLPPRFQRQQQQAEQQHLPSLRGPSSPPPRPRPTSGPTPPGGAQPSPSPPSVTSSEPSTPAEGRGSLLTHESRWGSLGSSQPPMHYPAQGISGMKSGSSSGRRGIRDEALTGPEREREAERDREDRNADRGRGSSSSSETSRPSANSNPLDIREKERSSEPKRVISTSEDRDRRMDDRYRHERNVRGSGMQGGYMENGRRAYYDGPDYNRGYNRGPPQDYDFDRPRSDRDHSVDADQPRFNDSRHGALSQSRDFDPWDRDREKDGRMMEKEGRDKERGVERERLSERGPERERERDRMDRERDRVPERGVIADRDRAMNDRDGRRVVSERDDRMERDRLVERERLLERGMERLERERGSRGVVDRPCDRDRNGERVPERGGERERASDRERLSERPSERERGSERDRITERDRQLERDSTRERDRPVDRERPNERERAAERERIDRVGERSDRQVERGFEGDIRGAERERSTLERTHERGQNERERGLQGRIGNRDRLRDRGVVERDGERDGERSIERESERRGGERGLERGQREGEYRDMRRFDDRRGGDALESKKGASGENYPERRGPPQQQDSFEPEVDNRQVALEWRESKEWKEDRRTGSISDERRQGTEDRPQRPDSRDDRNDRDSRRETSHDSKNSQLPEVSGDINGKGPSSNGGRRGDFVSSSSWADAPVEPLYADVQEEKKEEYFRNEHRPLIENSSNVERESEGAWGFPRGGPPSACAQGHVPRGPGAEQSGVVGVAAGTPTTRGPPNHISPSPPPPTTPSPSGEGPQSPGRPPRAAPLPLGGSSTAPPPPLQTRQPQRQLSSTTTPITPAAETTWADEPVASADSMQPPEERLAREMLPSAGEGGTMMDGKGPVNDKVKGDALEEKEPEHAKEEEKKEEEPLPKRERGGRGRSNQRPRQQGSSSRSGSQWAGARGGTSQSRGQRAPGVKWTEEEEEEAEINAGEGDSEFSAEEEGSGESGKEGRGVRSSSQACPEGEAETVGERHTAAQDSKRLQGREGFAPRGEPSRRGRGGGAGFRTRGNMGRRIDRYGPPPSGCPFGQPREEGPAAEAVEEQGEEKDKGKSSRHPPGSASAGKDGSSNRVGKSTQGSSSIPPRMQRRGDSDRSKKSRGGRGGGESGAQRSNEGGRKHVTGPESRQGSSDVAEWETTSENSDAEDSLRERREGKKGSKSQRGWSGSSDSATAGGSSSGAAVGGSATSRAPGAEKKSNSGGQRMSPAPVSRAKGKGKEESGNMEGSRRAVSGTQNRPSHTPLIGGNLDMNAEKAVEGIDVGTYSSVAPADDLRLVAEDQGDPPFPFDADTSGFREVRGRRGGGRIGAEESSMPVRQQQQQSSQRQQRREGPRGEGRGGKGGGKGQAPVGIGRSSGGAPRTGTPSPGPSNSSSAASVPLRPGSPSSVAGGSFERNRPKLPPRLIKQKETERLQKQQAQQQQGRGGHMGGSFNNAAYHSHHGSSSGHMRNDVGDANHHHPGKVVVSAGVLFPMKDSNGGAISSGVNAWEKPLGASSAIGSSSPASSSSGVGINLGGPGSSVGEERGGDSGGDRAVMSGSGSGHRDSPTGSEQGLGNGVNKVQSVQKLAIEKPSSVLLDGTSPPVQTIIFENTNYKSGPPSASAAPVPKYNSHHHHHHHHSHKMQRVMEKGRGNDRKMTDDSDDGVPIGYGGSKDMTKVGGIDVKADPMQLPLGFAKNTEDNSEMKLDFAFHSELSQLTEEKGHGGVKTGNNSGGGTIVGSMALQRNMHVGSTIGTAAELNYKIAAVKTFWENTPTMPTVLEISESNDGGSGVAVASSSVAAVTSASPSSSSPSLAPGVATVTTGFVVEQPSSSVVVVTGEDGSALSATEVVFSPGTPMQGSNSFGVAPASLGKGDPNSTTSNVCKVKPQQQTAVMSTGPSPIGHPGPLSPPPYNSSNAQATAGHINYQPTIGGTAQFGGMSAIPSPPSVIFNSSQQIPAQGGLYGAFPIDGQVLGGGARSQFPQFPSPYGLSQSIGGTSAFSPQSMYLHQPAPHPQPPPPTAAPDMYPSSLSQFRLQAAAGIGAPYAGSGHHVGGTTPPQAPAAMLISTPPGNSLAAVKPPPSQNQGTGGGQGAGGGGAQQPPPSQGAPPGAVGSKGATAHYGGTGTLSSAIPSAPQPSPVYIQYNDQGQAVLNHSFLSAGSQMVQRPGPVQSTVVPPPIQPPTSFYSTSAGRHFTLFAGGQTGFYQPGSSGLGQAQLHQTAAAAAAAVSSAFGLAQGFGPSQSAPTPVGLQNFGSQLAAAQQYRSTYLKSGGGGGGSSGMPSDHLQTGGRSQLKSPSANPGSQPQAPPPDVLTSPFSSAQIPSPKSRNTKLQGGPGAGNQQQQQSPTQASTHQKYSTYTPVTALVLQQQQQNSNVRNQMGGGMTGLMRSGASGNSMNSAPSRYPSPIQRPVAVAPGGNSNRHRMPQQRTNNIGKHYFGHDSKSEEGNEAGKMDGGKAANGRGGEVPASTSTPSPPNAASGQPSSPTTQASASADSAESVSGLEEQVPTTGAE